MFNSVLLNSILRWSIKKKLDNYVDGGGSWWYDKVKRMVISCISAGKIYIFR